jgi:tRNA modification GTPase
MHRSAATLTASLLTPPGRGAVAVVRVHDSAPSDQNEPDQNAANQNPSDCSPAALAVDASFVAVNGRPLFEQAINRLCYGHWETDDSREDVVVCRTDESTIEISCHGGRAAVDRILNSLKQAGASTEEWQTQQAAVTSLFQAELADALSLATTARAAAILVDQASGTLGNALEALLPLDPDQLADRLDDLLTRARFGLHLTQPWRVVLAGRPNVGKSTLINALLGYTRAIVFDQPGTTRDVVTGQTAFDGWPFQLADTAGIRNTTDQLEQAGIDRARRTVDNADLVCILLDTSQPATIEDHQLLAEFHSAESHRPDNAVGTAPPVIIVAHKTDLPDQWTGPQPDDASRVSSTTGDGVEQLIQRIVQTLIPAVPVAGIPVPVSRRQIQWLEQARKALAAGDTQQALAAITHCLSGVAFLGSPAESETNQ